MSQSAIALFHYLSNAEYGCADDSDRDFCLECARQWAAHIIGFGC